MFSGRCVGPWWRISVALTLVMAAPARAQQAVEPAAQALFDEARSLMAEQQYDGACEKFAQSQQLEAATGTLLNLAFCHEKQGRLATAYVEYSDALTLSLRQNDEHRAAVARRRLDELKARLPKVVIQVAEEDATPSVGVALDGSAVSFDVLGVALPVDLGKHLIEVTAPGKVGVRLVVDIDTEGRVEVVAVPPLEPALEGTGVELRPAAMLCRRSAEEGRSPLHGAPSRAALAPSRAAPAAGRASEPRFTEPARSMAIGASFGVAVATLLIGAYFGLDAMDSWDTRESHCTSDGCDSRGEEAQRRAERSAMAANVLFGAGAIASGVGLYLAITHNDSQEQTAAVPASRAPLREGFVGARWLF